MTTTALDFDLTPIERRRFLAKIQADASGCWLWTGAPNSKGYGCLVLRKRAWLAHRLAYVLAFGSIPDDYQVDHVWAAGCRHRNCVNPAHLEAVTASVNTRRSRESNPRPSAPVGYRLNNRLVSKEEFERHSASLPEPPLVELPAAALAALAERYVGLSVAS